MTQVKDLPKNIQEFLNENQIDSSNEVSWLRANPSFGDLPSDGQVSFTVGQGEKSKYVFVSKDGKVNLYKNSSVENIRAPLASMFADKGLQNWTQKIEAGFLGKPSSLPSSIRHAEKIQSNRARREIDIVTDLPPRGAMQQSSFNELAQLPLGHPARSFMEGLMHQFAKQILACEKADQSGSPRTHARGTQEKLV